MTPHELFQDLIGRPESQTLDFKETMYDLAGNAKYDVVKDVIAMANTPRTGSAYIVLGVAWQAGKPADLRGLRSQIDDSHLHDQLGASRILPVPPSILYHAINEGGKQFGIIEIPPERQVGPFFSASDVPDAGLYRDTLYMRIGSKNERALGHQQKRVWQWFSDAPDFGGTDSEQWTRVLDATEGFDDSRAYLLLCDRLQEDGHAAVAAMADLPWMAVVDCDPDSGASGVLTAASEPWSQSRTIVMTVKGERQPVQPRGHVTWFFARGLTGRAGTEVEPIRNKWLTAYGREMDSLFEHFARGVAPRPLTVMVVWHDPRTAWMVEAILDSMTKAFGDTASILVVTRDARLDAVGSERGAAVVSLGLPLLAGGVRHVLARRRQHISALAIPTMSGAPCPLDDRDRLWLQEELELIHLDSATHGPDGPEDFRRGLAITWRDLDNHADCDRTVTTVILDRVRKDLDARVTTRINVFHPAGAGGTTIARRVAWTLHDRFSCVVLSTLSGTHTAARLAKLAGVTQGPVLCIIDATLPRPSEVEDLFSLVRSEQTAVVFLQVIRRFQKPTASLPPGVPQRSFWLDLALDPAEAERFRLAYAHAVPARAQRFQELSQSKDARERTAFYFGLTAYGREFGGLRTYVAARLSGLNDLQRKCVGFLALAHHYGQQGLPEQGFAALFAVPRDRLVDLGKYLPPETMELIVPAEDDTVRTAHNLIAEEILRQLLNPGTDTNPDAWRQQLSLWATEFTAFLRSDTQLPSEQLVDLATRVFVLRDNSEMIGTESSAERRFSRIIEDIPSPQGQMHVLQTLTEAFPDVSHFYAHYGRFLGLAGRVDEALEAISRAIELSPDDPVLHHMRGMAHRYRMRTLIDQKRDLVDVIAAAQQAQEAFEASRVLNPENDHAYVSEVQMICQALDYATKAKKTSPMAVVMASSEAFIREGLERAETLMDQLRLIRGADRPSTFEIDCRAKLDLFYGDYSQALQGWQSVLEQANAVKPPIRRQIVWTLLHRAGDDWSQMRRKDAERCKELLRANVEESSADSSSMLLWLRAVRYGDHPPSLNALIERVSYWRANIGSADATYYLYVLHTLAAAEGSVVSRDDAERALEECRRLARSRRNRSWSFEWLGRGDGVAALVHQSALGQWKDDFYSDTSKLARVPGRVAKIAAAQRGEIELLNGQTAFFVPAKADLQPGRDENATIECFVGFSYDGLRAWQVTRTQSKAIQSAPSTVA
jgi:tetratricopeptide (TPR) repeat protein